MLGLGSVSVPNVSDNIAEFRIRNRKHIIQYVIPIFDKYPLLTSKYFNYNLFKLAAYVIDNDSLSVLEKDQRLTDLKSQVIPETYQSPVWSQMTNINDVIMKKS
jgi:hypothetical protein